MPPDRKTVGARTEHLRIAKATNGSAIGKVDWIEHLGDQNHLHVRVGDHRIVTLVDPEVGLFRGDSVSLALVDPLYFDASGNRIGADSDGHGCRCRIDAETLGDLIETVAATHDRACRRTDRPRPGDRRRRPRPQYEARLRGDPRRARSAIAAKPLPDALKALGMTLVMKVGGASGPLYGTLFVRFGKDLPADPTREDLSRALTRRLKR